MGAILEDSNAKGVGGDETDNTTTNSGAVYVFTRSETGIWSQKAYIKTSNTEANDNFSSGLALYGDTLAVGARLEDSNSTGVGGVETNNTALDSGAVYVFQ